MPSRDPMGFGRNDIDYMPQRIPRNYPRGTCQCEACVTLYCQGYGMEPAAYNPANYRQGVSSMSQSWSQTMDNYIGMSFPEGFTHPRRPSRWSNYEQETPLSNVFDSLINHPLRFILKRSGRVWSAEVECNDIDVNRAASVLGVSSSRYSQRPDQATIVATPDGTVDSEIKISCMRDGSPMHASMARDAYATLVQNGATCAVNAGHHVHVDGTRIADMGTEACDTVMRGVWRTMSVCRAALMPMAGSGYSKQRGSSTSFNEQNMNRSRQAVHGSRMYHAAASGTDRSATIEYRLPNATLSPIRAQSFITIPLGVLDFAERALLDEDRKAAEFMRQINDRHDHANRFDELSAVSFLLDAVNFSKDSRKALAVAAFTSPSVSKNARKLWEERADGLHTSLDKMVSAEEARIAKNKEQARPKKSKTITLDTSARAVNRDAQGRFAPQQDARAIWDTLIAQAGNQPQTMQIILDTNEYEDDPDYAPSDEF